ncbi:MAG: hypothetical protein ACI8P0_002207 [Planctomycetaceae bacterium]|jgi:hypothetical protein
MLSFVCQLRCRKISWYTWLDMAEALVGSPAEAGWCLVLSRKPPAKAGGKGDPVWSDFLFVG